MQQYQSSGQVDSHHRSDDAVNRLLRQAEISRLTRNLKSKLAHASLKTQKTPDGKSTQLDQRRRSKTLEGASPSPRPVDTPLSARPRSGSRRSSITSISSVSSVGSNNSVVSPRARIPRISSVNSIAEATFEGPETSSPNASRQFQSLQAQQIQLQQMHQSQQMQVHQQMQQQRGQNHQEPHGYSQAVLNGPVEFPMLNDNADHIYQRQLQRPISMHQRLTEQPHDQENDEENKDESNMSNGVNAISLQVDDEPLPQEPSTPPPLKRVLPQTPQRDPDSSTNDGANLLLHFAHSPGRGTPRTPDFNMSDYLHFQTPSPARSQLTPRRVRWGSLNSALFNQSGNGSLAPPAIPDLMHPAGSGSETAGV